MPRAAASYSIHIPIGDSRLNIREGWGEWEDGGWGDRGVSGFGDYSLSFSHSNEWKQNIPVAELQYKPRGVKFCIG